MGFPDPDAMGRTMSGRLVSEWQAFLKIKHEAEAAALHKTRA